MGHPPHERQRLERQLGHHHALVCAREEAHEYHHEKTNEKGAEHPRFVQFRLILLQLGLALLQLAVLGLGALGAGENLLIFLFLYLLLELLHIGYEGLVLRVTIDQQVRYALKTQINRGKGYLR